MRDAPEYEVELITNGRRDVLKFTDMKKAINSAMGAMARPDAVSVEIHVIIPKVKS